jgi:thiol-disulfide isomerase/thioredoxin
MQRYRFQTAARLMASLITLSVALSNIKAEAAATVPSFELITLGGEAFSKESLKGHPTLLVFWAPWCQVCQRELPLLSQFTSKEKPAQFGVISVGFADSRGNVEGFVKAHPEAFAFPTAFDIDNEVAQAFKVTATPTLILLDGQGKHCADPSRRRASAKRAVSGVSSDAEGMSPKTGTVRL